MSRGSPARAREHPALKAVNLSEELLNADMDFHILGLSPKTARLFVRFFLQNSFGAFLRNAPAHQQRLEIERPSYDTKESLSLWRLPNETVDQNARDKCREYAPCRPRNRTWNRDGRVPPFLASAPLAL